jgi:hypothetical protein
MITMLIVVIMIIVAVWLCWLLYGVSSIAEGKSVEEK